MSGSVSAGGCDSPRLLDLVKQSQPTRASEWIICWLCAQFQPIARASSAQVGPQPNFEMHAFTRWAERGPAGSVARSLSSA